MINNNNNNNQKLSPNFYNFNTSPSSSTNESLKRTKDSALKQLYITDYDKALSMESRSVKIYNTQAIYSGIKAKIDLPNELKDSMDKKNIAKLTKACMKDYKKSMDALEQSIADATLNNPVVKEFIYKASERLLHVIEVYSKLISQEKKLSSLEGELLTYKALADSFLLANPRTKNYAGNIGANPLAIKAALKEGNLREQLFIFLNLKMGLLGTIIKDSERVSQINDYLKNEKAGWQINSNDKFDKSGLYASETTKLPLRKMDDRTAEWTKEKAPTIEQGRKLRIPTSSREERYATKEPIVKDNHKNQKYLWSPGLMVWKPVTSKDQPENIYLQFAKDLKLKLVAGISGSTDQIMSAINQIGFDSMADMYLARMACLGWLVDIEAHSSYEVMTSSKSFGLEFTASPTFYKEIDPLNIGFLEDLEKFHKERGFEFPDYYLSQRHVENKYKQLF